MAMASLASSHPFPFPHKPLSSPKTSSQINVQTKPTSPPSQSQHETNEPNSSTPIDWPPLVCCFGAAQREFIPTVRVSERQMHPDQYSTWRMLHWDPPEFARAPSGPPNNVAVSHVRLGGRAAFMGKVGHDELGLDLVHELNWEKVQTRGVKISAGVKTGVSYMKLGFVDREDTKGKKLVAEVVKESAEDSFSESDINIDVLKEAKMFHFNSKVLLSPSMRQTVFKALNLSKQFGGTIFFDPNLPIPLWKSRDETLKLIKPAWDQSEVIEVSRHELEFLLDEPYFIRKRTVPPQYYAENSELTSHFKRDYYHYTRDDLAPLWHEGIKLLIVTHGTLRIHYYTQMFDGDVIGTEDVLVASMTCDRSGTGDAIVGAIMRKLLAMPKIYENQDLLERQLRFAIGAGIISMWTTGSIRGFPTESAAQNMKEQVYVPSLW